MGGCCPSNKELGRIKPFLRSRSTMRLFLTLLICFVGGGTAYAWDSAKPQPHTVYDSKSRILLGVYRLSNECGAKQSFAGLVTETKGDWPNFWISLKTPAGVKQIGVDVDNLSMADNGNLHYYLLKKGVHLKVDTYLCGSRGFLWANNIINKSF
jgi:hypothetical protein